MTELRSPLQAQLVQWLVRSGDTVRAGDVVVILEAMKMEHEVRAGAPGQVAELFFAPGETVDQGDVLMVTHPATATAAAEVALGIYITKHELPYGRRWFLRVHFGGHGH